MKPNYFYYFLIPLLFIFTFYIGFFVKEIADRSLVKLEEIKTNNNSKEINHKNEKTIVLEEKTKNIKDEISEKEETSYQEIQEIQKTQIWSYTFLITVSIVSLLGIVLFLAMMLPKALKNAKKYVEKERVPIQVKFEDLESDIDKFASLKTEIDKLHNRTIEIVAKQVKNAENSKKS